MSQNNSASDAFNDSLGFVKKLWGQMGVPGMQSGVGQQIPGMPGMTAPTMSVEELEKRITDLKTVESWLNMNLSMLRNTIQALEVQRATLATLHSLSATMSNTMQGITDPAGAARAASKSGKAEDAASALSQSTAWWQGVQDQFKEALGAALEKSAAVKPAAAAKPATTAKAGAAAPKAPPGAAKKPAARRKPAGRSRTVGGKS